ncbi:hypothetical protein K2173_027294 [Erythroxylum novogranatense]|uniref:Pentatricopeptide repeat-containing protein n=1 Tax=Erythroxylum novogranatense TaxID=1862640 RepID=A0AAV8TYK1_9ROSI|nr:hypothetical protein K2173_027294 [Erythroxylum novogranatense]
MTSILHPQPLRSPSMTLYLGSRSKKAKKQYQRQFPPKLNRFIRSFPKSSPTPLLVNNNPYPQTKLEALETVVNDLESSMEKGIFIDPHIFASLLRIHGLIPTSLLRKNVGISSKLLRLYASSGHVDEAHNVFDQMSNREKSAFAWNSLIAGYAELGQYEDAMALYFQMQEDGVIPDQFTFPRVLKACGGIGLIGIERQFTGFGPIGLVAISTILANVSYSRIGAQVHGWIMRKGMEWDVSIANSLILWYANNGKLDLACWVFDHMPERDIVSWNSVISAHRMDPKALSYFECMEKDGILPDNITYVSTLSACAHLGLVKDGERLYSLMIEKYGIEPITEHYACMVNLYGRAGLINEAYAIIVEKMEFEASPTMWGALLYACYLHGNVEIGEIAAGNLFELEPDNEHNFQLLMEIYGNEGRASDVERVRTMLADRGL